MVYGSRVYRSHPSASFEYVIVERPGSGGTCPPRTASVYPHHAIMITTITVVMYMIRSAFSLDSGIPLMFSHQKYTVTRIAKNAAVAFIGNANFACPYPRTSLINPVKYRPAETPLMGPVRM